MLPSDKDRFWLLAGLKLNGEASEEELRELKELAEADAELQYQLNRISQLCKFKSVSSRIPDADKSFNKHLQRLSNHLSDPALKYERREEPQAPAKRIARKKGKLVKLSVIAASVAASFIFFFMISKFYADPRNAAITANTISTKSGSKSKVELPDGTQVWLNADSRLTYSREFGNKIREVSLSGEAFFDVKRDEKHPFIIHANSLELKVLGTAFNVRSYQNEKTSEATLIRGSIEVIINHNPDKKIILKPSDKIVVQNEITGNRVEGAAREKPADTLFWVGKVNSGPGNDSLLEAVWKANNLAFKNETLEDVALRIEHWYNVKVSILDDELKKATYSGDFKHETLKEVLEALHLTGNFKYQIVKDTVTITK